MINGEHTGTGCGVHFFKKKHVFLFCFRVFVLICKVFDQSTQWKNVLIEPKDNIKWRGPGCEREREKKRERRRERGERERERKRERERERERVESGTKGTLTKTGLNSAINSDELDSPGTQSISSFDSW